jgi:hypothetical protein
MRKPARSRNKSLSGKSSKHTLVRKEPKAFQLVFSFLTAPVK